MLLNHDYLTKQIIAYIGNKRKLISLIHKAIINIYKKIPKGIKFLDLFAGSGIVSRLAKYLNLEVLSNDWEYFSYILCRGYIKVNENDIPALFGSNKAFLELLEELNNLSLPDKDNQYIAKYYAPSHFETNNVNYKKERLFYTRENALTIDKIRNRIDYLYPKELCNTKMLLAKDLLLSILLYQSATHTNTSGVFKAFHKGFGGHAGDALSRILSKIKLKPPPLINSEYPCRIFKEDANIIIKKKDFQNIDIAYIDPPYNQHQYASNYHMLNTIALWDRIPVPLIYNKKGELKEKAGIRKDWIKTRSDYCYSVKATSAFEELIKNIDAENIIISYSTDGIIPFPVMKDICAKKGLLSIITNEYVKYPGGKQSNSRLNTNIEFVLIIDSTKKPSRKSLSSLNYIISVQSLILLFKNRYIKNKLKKQFDFIKPSLLKTRLKHNDIVISTDFYFKVKTPDNLYNLHLEDINILKDKFSKSMCITKEEELYEIYSRMNTISEEVDFFIKLVPHTLKKLAHKKNKKIFYTWLEKIKKIENTHSEKYKTIKSKILEIENLALKRFYG